MGRRSLVKAGIAERKAALLVIVAATAEGEKVLLACQAGERESKESWLSLLRGLKARGLVLPRLTVADGHLGIWSALGELHPAGDEQGCWNHKIPAMRASPTDVGSAVYRCWSVRTARRT